MAILVVVRGSSVGHRYFIEASGLLIGRQFDAEVYLDSLAVSRYHARLLNQSETIYIEDLQSSNGTFVNGHRINGKVRLLDGDLIEIGPYDFRITLNNQFNETQQVIRARVEAHPSNITLFANNAATKLERMLQIAQDLGRNLEVDPLLTRLLEHLLVLFPQADRGIVLICDEKQFIARAQRRRLGDVSSDYGYSKTIVQKALDEGVGLLSEDVRGDREFVASETIISLNIRSFLCVPLIGWDKTRLGVIQLDSFLPNNPFRPDDLEMLIAIGLQAAVVLQNATFHAQCLREQRLKQEVLMAREIQSQFLPNQFDIAGENMELFARCVPAREVSGDLYDFFQLPDKRLAFYVGDVSGKGVSAALFMIAVRTLARYLISTATNASDFLYHLNNALTRDNPTHLYVTMLFAIYDENNKTLTIASGGHPAPLLRRIDGLTDSIHLKPSMMLGQSELLRPPQEVQLNLYCGETLIFYTDGFYEATNTDGTTQFGIARLCETFAKQDNKLPLEEMANRVTSAVEKFAPGDHQDDMTLLLLRRIT